MHTRGLLFTTGIIIPQRPYINFVEVLSSHSTLTARLNSSIFAYFVEPMDGSTKYAKIELFRRAVKGLCELKSSTKLLHAGVAVL